MVVSSNKNQCPACGGKKVAGCRCPSFVKHDLAAILKGCGSVCENGHRWGDDDITIDIKTGKQIVLPTKNLVKENSLEKISNSLNSIKFEDIRSRYMMNDNYDEESIFEMMVNERQNEVIAYDNLEDFKKNVSDAANILYNYKDYDAKIRFNDIKNHLKLLGNTFKVYRAFSIYKFKTVDNFIKAIKKGQDVGNHWSWDEQSAITFGDQNISGDSILLECTTKSSNVDWKETMLMNMDLLTGPEENEIVINSGAQLELHTVSPLKHITFAPIKLNITIIANQLAKHSNVSDYLTQEEIQVVGDKFLDNAIKFNNSNSFIKFLQISPNYIIPEDKLNKMFENKLWDILTQYPNLSKENLDKLIEEARGYRTNIIDTYRNKLTSEQLDAILEKAIQSKSGYLLDEVVRLFINKNKIISNNNIEMIQNVAKETHSRIIFDSLAEYKNNVIRITSSIPAKPDEYYESLKRNFSSDFVEQMKDIDNKTGEYFKFTPIYEKSDSGNLILSYAESGNILYIIGLTANSGSLKRTDVPDLLKWIDELAKKITSGINVYTSLNDKSEPLISNLLKKHPEFKMTKQGPKQDYEDNGSYQTVLIHA